jgi:hypothetical protein
LAKRTWSRPNRGILDAEIFNAYGIWRPQFLIVIPDSRSSQDLAEPSRVDYRAKDGIEEKPFAALEQIQDFGRKFPFGSIAFPVYSEHLKASSYQKESNQHPT